MSPTISNQNLLQGTAATTSTGKEKSVSQTAASIAEQKPTAANMRSSLNAQIIEASMKVSINSGDNPQGLLFRSSLESIYEALNGKFESKITPDYQMPSMNDADNPYATPEGTANVILSFSLGLYERFAASHKGEGEDEAEVAAKFIDIIRGGFEKGYGEAVDILTGIGVFEGNIADEIGKTWDLVQQGYDTWLADKLASLQPAEAAETTETGTDTNVVE